MPITPPIPLIRKMHIIKKLRKANAYDEASAKYLDEIGVFNPYAFYGITKRMVASGTINKTKDGRYYLNRV